MNSDIVLAFLLGTLDKVTPEGGPEVKFDSPTYHAESLEEKIEDLLVSSSRKFEMPPRPSGSIESYVSRIRDLYSDDVTLVSLVLNHHFPDEFYFYRFSKLEREIFAGLGFFSDHIRELDFDFDSIGRNGVSRYRIWNDQMKEFWTAFNPDDDAIQRNYRLAWFLYNYLPALFVQRSDYNRYWIISTSREDDSDLKFWSLRKDVQLNDLVFRYQQSPTKAVTSIWKVCGTVIFNPWSAWDGFWAYIEALTDIPEIPFSKLRQDSVFKEWSVVRRQFQGVVTEPVPHSIYNRLLEFVPDETMEECDLTPELITETGDSVAYSSEADFEDKVIDTLLRDWGFSFDRQHTVKSFFGQQRVNGYVDFLVKSQGEPITLFENKLAIRNDQQRHLAIEQAKSYALVLGLPSFVVSSPAGLQLYALDWNQESLVAEYKFDSKANEEKFRNEILRLASE